MPVGSSVRETVVTLVSQLEDPVPPDEQWAQDRGGRPHLGELYAAEAPSHRSFDG
jgi:hypothetical protein